MKNIQRIAIITGITKGIGKAIAESLAARRINLVGVSRNEKNITELFERLCSKHKIDCSGAKSQICEIRLKPLTFFHRHFQKENKKRKVVMRTIKYL